MAGIPSCLPYLQLAILLLIDRRGPICGYRIVHLLKLLGLNVGEAAVYTALSKMRRKGLIQPIHVVKEGRRVVRYVLTEKGRRELRELLEAYMTLEAAIHAILSMPPAQQR